MATVKRAIIYANEVMILTGKSESSARRLMARIKKHYHKSERAMVTIKEFCEYTGVNKGMVAKCIR